MTVFIAQIGVGLIGKRHLQHIVESPNCELAAIVEPFPAGEELAKKHNVPWFKTLPELIAAKEKGAIKCDGAIVGTPTNMHVPQWVELVAAGIHALVEKPIASDLQSAEELCAAVRVAPKAKVLIGQHRRMNPYSTGLKSAIDSGDLGTILAIQGIWSTRKNASYYEGWHIDPKGGGTISINMIHDIDLLTFLLGPIDRIYCEEGLRTRGLPVEETGSATIKFKSGAVGTFIFSDAAASPFCFEGATGENADLVGHYGLPIYTIIGTKGSIQFPNLQLFKFPTPTEADPLTDDWLHRLTTDSKFFDEAKKDLGILPFTLQLEHFVRVIKGEEEPRCTAEDGTRSLKYLEGLRVSMIEKRVVDVSDINSA